MFCVWCGAEIENDSKFCPICGKSQSAPQDGAPPQPAPGPVPTEAAPTQLLYQPEPEQSQAAPPVQPASPVPPPQTPPAPPQAPQQAWNPQPQAQWTPPQQTPPPAWNQSNPTPPQKKSSKAPLIIVLALLVCAAAAAAVYYFFLRDSGEEEDPTSSPTPSVTAQLPGLPAPTPDHTTGDQPAAPAPDFGTPNPAPPALTPVPVPVPDPMPVSPPATDYYILPDSDSRYLTWDDLAGLSAEELRLARNEIYARHGRMFNDQALQDYFDQQSWYTGTIAPEDFTQSLLNDYEIQNATLILDYENGR